jgi:putative hemolysin
MEFLISLPVTLVALLLLTFFSFFFSASETAIIAMSKIRLHHMLTKGIKRAQNLQRLITRSDHLITAILIGNNFVNIAISAIVTALFIQIFGYRWGIVIATFSTTLFVLIFCEITPKIMSLKHTEKIALFTAPLMEAFVNILNPIVHIFIGVSNMILRVFGISTSKRSPLITEEELRLMIEVGKEEGVLTDEERKMLHHIFEFGDIKVGEVMVPKEKIVAVNITAGSEQLLNTFVEQGHARLPVYSGSYDNIIGIIYAQDLLYILRDKSLFVLQDLIHKAYYVPAACKVNELLRKFQSDKVQIAVVVDENDRTVGLVTLEDLIEEIVGEIEEEHPRHSK